MTKAESRSEEVREARPGVQSCIPNAQEPEAGSSQLRPCLKKGVGRGKRDGSAVKSMYCSFRGSEFSSQFPSTHSLPSSSCREIHHLLGHMYLHSARPALK